MSIRDSSLKSLTNENKADLRRLLCQPERSIGKSNVDFEVSAHVLREKDLDEIFVLLGKNGFHKALMRDGDVSGVILAEKSAWDSTHFGFGVGRIRHMMVSDAFEEQSALDIRDCLLEDCLDWMKQNEVKCVIARVDLDCVHDIAAYEQRGFKLVDVLATFHLSLDSVNSDSHSQSERLITIRPSCAKDELKLMEIARNAFMNDHFHRDSRFPRNKSDELFAKWVYNCCHGRVDAVLVAETESEEPCGFITCKIEQLQRGLKYGVIDLVAVSPLRQGSGIGSQLVTEAIRWFSQHVQLIFVGTQANNHASIRTYEKAGFRPFRTELTFHKWLR